MMENMVLSGTSESSKVKFVRTNFRYNFVRRIKKKIKKRFGRLK